MPVKVKSFYICNNCGYQTSKWLGKCPNCNQWNTIIEEVVKVQNKSNTKHNSNSSLKLLSEITISEKDRVKCNISEFDRLLGGGVIPGSLILISGEPGIGKSTLLLQIAANYSKNNKVLYISAEESEQQIKIRADRLNIKSDNLYILAENDILTINQFIKDVKPAITIIDSIQTIKNIELNSLTGAVSQIKESTNLLLNTAKQENTTIFLVGHITKEGAIAGPKILEHMVDVVLYMEGDRNLDFRIVKSNKNRFGSTFEIAVFEMSEQGLKQITNPTDYFIDKNKQQHPGSVIANIMEGTRPILIEIQALVAPSTMAYPRRVAEGIDYNKVILISAILEKILGIQLANQEIYLKITGGIKVQEPSTDLGIAAAILSSYKNIPINNNTIIIGEIGLTGEIRPIPYIEQRLNDIKKSGFQKIFLPAACKKNITKRYDNIDIKYLNYITDIYQILNQENVLNQIK